MAIMPTATQPVRWTISDLEGFPDNGNRYEIIDGELFVTRSPHWNHQDAATAIATELRFWSKQSGLGKVVTTPGIIFSESDHVIPDVVWISHQRLADLLDDAGQITGAPELIVEVLSQSEKDKDRDKKTKLKLYSAQGVQEYWIVDYQQQQIEVYRRQQAVLARVLTLFATDELTSPLLPEFRCLFGSLFSGGF